MAFETSDSYKAEINSLTKTSKITGQLTTVNGDVIEINNDIISSGSLYITNQCVNSDAFEYGSVFAAELGMSLKTSIDRYSLFDAKVELSYNLLTSSNSYEKIPLGIFYVNEPERVGNLITIKAYDGMLKLDVDVIENYVGKPYELLLLIQKNCGIELAQEEAEIDELTNGEMQFSLNKESVDTYRELLSYICMVTCTFAVFDRYGKLKLCTYSKSVNFDINSDVRMSSKYSDFSTYYTKIKAKFLVSGAYEEFVSGEDESGLVYDMGEVPIVQGLNSSNQAVIDFIYDTLKLVNYVPCDITISGDPSIDLGDMITNTDINGNEYSSLVTFYKWTYRSSEQIKSAGSNPKIASIKEKNTNVTMSDVANEVSKNSMQVFTYTNPKAITVEHATELKKYSSIMKLSFSSVEDTTALLFITVPINLLRDGWVEFTTLLDSVAYEHNLYRQYCEKGNNIISFCTYIPCKEYKTYRLEIRARTYNYTVSDLRQQEADIKTNQNAISAIISAFNDISTKLKEGTSLPISDIGSITYDKVNPEEEHAYGLISAFAVKAIVLGQGFAGETPWDGTLVFDEQIDEVNIGKKSITIENITDALSVTMKNDTSSSIIEAMNTLQLASILTDDFHDSLLGNETITNYTFETDKYESYSYNSRFVNVNESFMLQTNETLVASEIAIDEGKAESLHLDFTQYNSVSNVEMEVE